MSRNLAYYLAGLATMIVVACGGGGGGGSSGDTPSPAPVPAYSNVLALGNSISKLPVDATYVPGSNEWGPGGWGMSASAPEKDYVHQVARELGLPFLAMNLAENERNASAPLPAFSVGPRTITILQLGDNGLPARYAELVERAKVGALLICISSFGPNLRDRDAAMRPICEAAGGKWVDITDLAANPAMLGFYGHPNDAGMTQIAVRTVAVVPR